MRRPSFLFRCKIRLGKTRIPFGEKQISGGFMLRDARFKRVFRKCEEKPETSEHTPFSATKSQVADAQSRGLVDRSRFFTALPESLDGSMRQISEPSSTLPFSCKETAGRNVVTIQCGRHVKNLPHTSGLGAHFALSKSPHPLKKFLRQP